MYMLGPDIDAITNTPTGVPIAELLLRLSVRVRTLKRCSRSRRSMSGGTRACRLLRPASSKAAMPQAAEADDIERDLSLVSLHHR